MRLSPRASVHDDEAGAILVLSALLLVVLIGFATLAMSASGLWSSQRAVEASADLAALSAVREIPHTYVTSSPMAADAVEAEVASMIERNGCGRSCTITEVRTELTHGPSASTVEVHLKASVENPTGGVSAIPPVVVTAEVSVVQPSLATLPVGLETTRGNPLRCITTNTGGAVPNGCNPDLSLLPIRRVETDPSLTSCDDRYETTIRNLQMPNGLDHLIGVMSPSATPRPDDAACEYARKDHEHTLTFPTHMTRRLSTEEAVPLIGPGLVTPEHTPPGRLSDQNEVELWDYLPDSPVHLRCDKDTIQEAAQAEPNGLADATILMARCIEYARANPGQVVLNLGVANPRLAWGLTVSGTMYTGYAPIWLHTIIDETGQQSLSNPSLGGDIAGMTTYVLPPHMIPEALTTYGPVGDQNLEFALVTARR